MVLRSLSKLPNQLGATGVFSSLCTWSIMDHATFSLFFHWILWSRLSHYRTIYCPVTWHLPLNVTVVQWIGLWVLKTSLKVLLNDWFKEPNRTMDPQLIGRAYSIWPHCVPYRFGKVDKGDLPVMDLLVVLILQVLHVSVPRCFELYRSMWTDGEILPVIICWVHCNNEIFP